MHATVKGHTLHHADHSMSCSKAPLCPGLSYPSIQDKTNLRTEHKDKNKVWVVIMDKKQYRQRKFHLQTPWSLVLTTNTLTPWSYHSRLCFCTRKPQERLVIDLLLYQTIFLRQEVTYQQELGRIHATGQCHTAWRLKGYRAWGVTCHHWALPRKEQLCRTEDTFSRSVWLVSWFTSKQGLTKGSVEQKLFGMLNWRTLRGL